ncbi:MAG: hypothetical protein H0W69_01530 [Gemmatimonadaceae bacterium]|nr:hypothetical protein [Gemmatimonadaceae bacterium]
MTKARQVPIVVKAAVLLFASAPLRAQETRAQPGLTAVSPGGELDEYLRYLQTSGSVGPSAWTVREHSTLRSALLLPMKPNPWAVRFKPAPRVSGAQWTLFPVTTGFRVNSGFPFGGNDGAVWAGRGLTVHASGGGIVKYGPIVLQLAPVVFWAQNAAFPLQNNGEPGQGAFRSGQPQFAGAIDLPQRFGSGSYSRFDPGESEVRFETPWIMAGLSNAHRLWGPASSFPFILGRNAAGFEHLFVSTNQPLDLWFARLTASVMYGRLSQSEYSPVTGPSDFFSVAEPGRRRFGAGVIAVFQPRGAEGVEIGVSRFYHSLWPRSGIPRSYFTKPFQNFLKKSLDERNARSLSDTEGSDNQLLAVFARWVLPHSGAEFYAEYGRDDHSYDFRDLISEPDHTRSYMLGARKVLAQDERRLSAIRAEIINYQLPTTARHRDEGGIYVHTLLRQGHTQRGQMLGAPLGPGASAGSIVAYDRFSADGRFSIIYTRTLNQEAGTFFSTGFSSPSAIDVTHALGVERLVFRGAVDFNYGLTFARNFNRNFGSDALNLSAVAGARYNLR